MFCLSSRSSEAVVDKRDASRGATRLPRIDRCARLRRQLGGQSVVPEKDAAREERTQWTHLSVSLRCCTTWLFEASNRGSHTARAPSDMIVALRGATESCISRLQPPRKRQSAKGCNRETHATSSLLQLPSIQPSPRKNGSASSALRPLLAGPGPPCPRGVLAPAATLAVLLVGEKAERVERSRRAPGSCDDEWKMRTPWVVSW